MAPCADGRLSLVQEESTVYEVLSELTEKDPATLLPESLMEAFKPLNLIVKNTFFDELPRPGSLEQFLKERLAISCPATRQNTLERGKSLATEHECLAEMSPCVSALATSAGSSLRGDDEGLSLALDELPSSPRGSWCSTCGDMDEMCALEEEDCVRANPVVASGMVVLPARLAVVGQQVQHAGVPAARHAMSLPPLSQMAPVSADVPYAYFSAPLPPLQPRACVQQPLTSMDTPMMLSQPQQSAEAPLLLSTAPQPSQPSYSSSYHPPASDRDACQAPLLLANGASATMPAPPRESICRCREAASGLPPVCEAEEEAGEPETEVVTTNPGSLLHDGFGKCTPCMFVHEGGCRAGIDCQYCHKCPAGEQKRRKVAKLHEQKRRRRQERHARKVAAREAGMDAPDEHLKVAGEEDEDDEDVITDVA